MTHRESSCLSLCFLLRDFMCSLFLRSISFISSVTSWSWISWTNSWFDVTHMMDVINSEWTELTYVYNILLVYAHRVVKLLKYNTECMQNRTVKLDVTWDHRFLFSTFFFSMFFTACDNFQWKCVPSSTSGKLPFECQKIAKN